MTGRNKLTLAAGGFLLLVIAFLAWQNYDLRQTNARLMNEKRFGRGKDGRMGEDPYRAQAVKNTITTHAGELQGCYNALVARKPVKTDGTVKLDWRILPSGKVSRPGVVFSEIGDEAFRVCVTGAVAAWDFPTPPGGDEYYVEHKFQFKKAK